MKPTRIVAIDTSDQRGSVALLTARRESVETHRQQTLPVDGSTAAELIPLLRELIEAQAWTVGDPRLIAVVVGPGSFTGLRIGVTAAKTLAYATGAHLVGISTTEALAQRVAVVTSVPARLWTIVDAYRGELFVQAFRTLPGHRFEPASPLERCSIATWLEGIAREDRITGPGVIRVVDQLPPEQFLDREPETSLAAAAGQVGSARFQQGALGDLWTLVPQYHRKSAAEEKRDASQP